MNANGIKYGLMSLLAAISVSASAALIVNSQDLPENQDPLFLTFRSEINKETQAIRSGKYEGRELAERYRQRGNVRDDVGEIQSALQDLSQAIALDPAYAEALVDRGVIHTYSDNPTAAEVDFDRAIALNPNLSSAYKARAQSAFLQGQYAAAEADIKRYLALDSFSMYGQIRLFLIAESNGNRGVQETQEMMQELPQHWPAPVMKFLHGAISAEELLQAAQQQEQISPRFALCETYYYLAEYHLIKKNLPEAKKYYQMARDTNAWGYIEFGSAKLRLKQMF